MTKEQINKLNELSNKFGESQSNNVFDIMEAARCYRVGYRAGFEDAKEEMNKHVDQATDLVFSACDRSNAVVDKLMSKNDQITELTRKLEWLIRHAWMSSAISKAKAAELLGCTLIDFDEKISAALKEIEK